MLKIEKLEMNDHVVKRNLKAVRRGDAVLHLGTLPAENDGDDPTDVDLNGKFHVSRVGTGWMAEVSVACKADAKVDVTPGELTLALTAKIRRLVKKGEEAIDISDIFNGTVDTSAADADAVFVDNVKKGCTKGVIAITAPAANEMVEITFPLTKATPATDPDMPANAALALQPGEYHIHILSRLVDDPEGTNMPNPTSFTVTRHCKANLDLA